MPHFATTPPDDWLHGLDYSTLEKLPGSYVTDDYRHRADDVVWWVKVEGRWVYLYILIEFQSSVDSYMAVRMILKTARVHEKHEIHERNQCVMSFIDSPVRCRSFGR